MQGKKKSISACYNLAVARISYGIQTEGGYIVEMDADVLAAAPDEGLIATTIRKLLYMCNGRMTIKS